MDLEVRLAPWVEDYLRYVAVHLPERAIWDAIGIVIGEGIEIRLERVDNPMTWAPLRMPPERVGASVAALYAEFREQEGE